MSSANSSSHKENNSATFPNNMFESYDPVQTPTMNNGIQEYEQAFIQLSRPSGFHNEDLILNKIVSVEEMELPKFVTEFYRKLQRKRILSSEHIKSTILEQCTVEFTITNHKSRFASAQFLEEQHTTSLLNSMERYPFLQMEYSDTTIPSLVFRPFHQYLYGWYVEQNLLSDLQVTYPMESWPDHKGLIVYREGQQTPSYYRPKNTFSFWLYNHPRLLVETCSNTSTEERRIRLLIEGASAVRTINIVRESRTFVLPLVYVERELRVTLYLIYEENLKEEVRYWSKTFTLRNATSLIDFLRHLYNLGNLLDDQTMLRWKKNIQHTYRTISKNPYFTSTSTLESEDPTDKCVKRKRKATTNLKGADDHTMLNSDVAGAIKIMTEQFSCAGYLLSDDFHLTQDQNKRPKIFFARSHNNASKEVVLKEISKLSQEHHILQYIKQIPSRCEHIIDVLDTTETNIGVFMVLPRYTSLSSMLRLEEELPLLDWFYDIASGLVDGLLFLHNHLIAHLDIKMDNLVVKDDCCLQIIDFSSSIQMENEETRITGHFGTEGYMAPEIRSDSCGFNPIKADLFSCGCVFRELGALCRRGDRSLSYFGYSLTVRDPARRPNLTDWLDERATKTSKHRMNTSPLLKGQVVTS